jgi:hypothetical protein
MLFSIHIGKQGDNMNLWKIAQNVAESIFRQNKYKTFIMDEGTQNILANSVIFDKNAKK